MSRLENEADGPVKTCPLLEFATVSIPGLAVLVHLNYADSSDQAGSGEVALRLVLTPEQALALGQQLLKEAESPASRPPDDAH